MAPLKRELGLLKATWQGFSNDECTRMAAALSYYTVFALPPLLILLILVAGSVWDPAEVERALEGQFRGLIGGDAAGQIKEMIHHADRPDTGEVLPTVLGVGALAFGATGAFVQLQEALNRAWGVEPDPAQGGIRNFILKRLISLGMVLGIGFLLAVSLALTAGITAVGGALGGGVSEPVLLALNLALTFAVMTSLFAAMFKVLPDAVVAWRDVWVGGLATTVLFVIGKFLIGFYLGQSEPGSAYGAAAALAVILLWVYYAAIILLLGAEFTEAWAERRGARIEPEEGAVRVEERKLRVGAARPARASDERGSRGERAPAGLPRRPTDPKAGTPRSDGERPMKEKETTADVRRDIEITRERMSQTTAELDARISGAIEGVKEKLDLARVVREHPWPALAAALAAGVALGASRADRKAAAAAVRAAKQAPDASVSAAKSLAAGAAHLASAAANRIKGAPDEQDEQDERARRDGGVIGRGKAKVAGVLRAQADELRSEMAKAADELTGSAAPRPAATDGPRPELGA